MKNYFFSRSGCSAEVSLWKNYLFWKKIVLKKELLRKNNCSEEIAAPEKQLFCQRSYFKEAWRSSFYKKLKKIKLSWKSRYISEKGNCNLKKNCQFKLVLTVVETIFPYKFIHSDKYSWGISYEYLQVISILINI